MALARRRSDVTPLPNSAVNCAASRANNPPRYAARDRPPCSNSKMCRPTSQPVRTCTRSTARSASCRACWMISRNCPGREISALVLFCLGVLEGRKRPDAEVDRIGKRTPNVKLCGGPPRCQKMVRRFRPDTTIVGRSSMQGRLCDELRRREKKRNGGATKCDLRVPTTEWVSQRRRQCLSRR